MWNYQDTSERTKARGALFKDPEWLSFLEKNAGAVVEMNNVMLIPTDYSGLK
jgi:hypothetical protein